nr:hypothetical protein [Brevundimonas sp. SH203]
MGEVVLLAVNLDAEAVAGPIEVQDEGVQGMLATKAVAPDAPPDQDFRQRHRPAETSGAFLGKDRRSHGAYHHHKPCF